MRVALYARVSTTRQAQAQTIEQQLTRLPSLVEQQGWILSDQHIYRDDGLSGASLNRPGSIASAILQPRRLLMLS